jgi:membrane protease YdiL (CAAX protease family)
MEHILMLYRTFPWFRFSFSMGLISIATFLAFPRPFEWTTLLISISFLGILLGTGLLMAKSVGLKTFIVDRKSLGWSQKELLGGLGQAILIGVGLGAIILGAIRSLLFIVPKLGQRFAVEASIAVWKRVIIAFDSAILEEFVFRLFLFSFLIWLSSKILYIQNSPNPAILWIANFLIAIAFGAAHLPQWSNVTQLTFPIICIVIFLNSIGGLIFGCLFFSKGLEAAIITHFIADIVFHVIGPFLLQT